jgi:hypothetical protein
MQTPKPLVRDFILFCIRRCSGQWPVLYDEMCLVAGCRLFHGMGHNELRQLGLSFALDDIDKTLQMVDYVVSQASQSALQSQLAN